MKKLAFLSAFAGLFLTACVEEYTVEPAAPQTWEQEEFVTLPSSVSVAAVEAIDLAKVEADSVVVGTLTPLTVAEGEVKYSVVFEDTYKFEVDENLSVPVDSLQNVVVAEFGKRPSARTLSAVVLADVVVNGQASLVASEAFNVVVTPVAPFISTGYYIIGNMNDWNTDNALNFKFKHSGKDVYEDPVFTITFNAGADCYWKIIPQSNYDANDPWRAGVAEGVVGVAVDGDSAAEGTLVTENPQAGKIAEEGMYKMTINMIEYTYSIQKLEFVEYIYVPGNHQGWSPEKAPALWSANFDGVWTGFSMLDGGFKFTHERKWAGEYKGSDFATKSEGLSGDNDIVASKKAFYYIKADVANSDLSVTEIKSFGIIGPAQEGGWDTDTDMTWDAEKGAWVATGVTLKADELKFRANDAWDINVGGTFDNLVENAGNIKVEAGTYDIELYLQRVDSDNMYAVLTKK